MIHFTTFTFFLGAVCLCALASILSRLLPKLGTKQPETTFTNTPIDYQTYVQHKILSEQYDKEEPFSFSKFFSGFGQSKNWAKAIAIGLMLVVVLTIGYCIVHEAENFLGKKTPPVASTITNTGGGQVESKTESKQETKQSNGLNLNIFSSWF